VAFFLEELEEFPRISFVVIGAIYKRFVRLARLTFA